MNIKIPRNFASNVYHERYQSRQLNLGYPTAHMRIHLMLLPSGPDMIHGFILHRTEIFKHLVLWADFTSTHPRQSIQSRISGFREQGTATSPPSTARYIILYLKVVMQALTICKFREF